MPDNKKEQERAELHRTIWNIANDLRGSVDGWDFKQYVLGILFYRYISENLAGYGTSIATCVMVLKRSKRENSTLFIDASHEFIKVTNSNKLTQENIEKIVAVYTGKGNELHFAKLVPNSDIAAQGYNLSVSTYVEQEDKREAVDIAALNAEIERIVAREDILRREINAIIAEIEEAV